MGKATASELEIMLHNAVAALINAQISINTAKAGTVKVVKVNVDMDLVTNGSTMLDVSVSLSEPLDDTLAVITELPSTVTDNSEQLSAREVQNIGGVTSHSETTSTV